MITQYRRTDNHTLIKRSTSRVGPHYWRNYVLTAYICLHTFSYSVILCYPLAWVPLYLPNVNFRSLSSYRICPVPELQVAFKLPLPKKIIPVSHLYPQIHAGGYTATSLTLFTENTFPRVTSNVLTILFETVQVSLSNPHNTIINYRNRLS